eukprot:m.397961 g.397961  ORF g.397961 m.397961 type:complete len:943 (+) comp20108_c2_seq2:205-3033(+)
MMADHVRAQGHCGQGGGDDQPLGHTMSAPVAIPGGRRHSDIPRTMAASASPARTIGTPLQPRSAHHLKQHARHGSPTVQEAAEDGDDDWTRRRRAVSDAAQWIRERQHSRLQRELLPSSSDGAKPHAFAWVSSSAFSAFCAVCSKAFWGFHRQGLKCVECGIEVHKTCQFDAPSCLGKHGSIASHDLPAKGSFDGSSPGRLRLTRVCISSADKLARKSMMRLPDPFAVVVVDEERFQTSMAKKTLSPVWSTQRDMYLSATSTITIYVFDSKKFVEGEWHGFLGMAIVPVSALMCGNSLGEGATSVHTFRLKKRQPADVVTGTVSMRVKVLPPPSSGARSPTAPMPVPSRLGSESPMVATSPGQGWQKLPEELPKSPFKSLVPPKPGTPQCRLVEGEPSSVFVTWPDPGVSAKESGVHYTLAVTIDDSPDNAQDIYSGSASSHTAVGFKPGEKVRFMVKASNFYGSSEYSSLSLPVVLPETSAAAADGDDRKHCPMFMAGFCFRGAECPMSHGSGIQTEEDIAAAMVAATFFADPDVQLAAAMAASLNDSARERGKFDPAHLSQFQRDFHEKESKFRSKMKVGEGETNLTVSRADIFKTSLMEVAQKPASELRKSRLMVQFLGEGGLDYGGLAREWFFLLSHEILHPSYGMFLYCGQDNYALMVNPESASDPDHLLYFHFVGRILGLAILHRHFIDATFSIVFFKKLLDLPLTLSDLQDVDHDVHQSLLWVLENNVDEVPDLYFTVDYDSFGEIKSHELKPGGADMQVTEANKHEFVRLMTEWRLSRGTDNQIAALLAGLHDIIPRELLVQFNPRELEHLLGGTKQIDLADWQAHTVYKGGYSETSDQVGWLREIVGDFDSEQQARFFQFCTGTSRVPLEGFQALQGSDGPRKFCIQMLDDLTRLPSAHTCFNRLDLPPYPDKATLREKLVTAMDCAEGFHGD